MGIDNVISIKLIIKCDLIKYNTWILRKKVNPNLIRISITDIQKYNELLD